MKKKTLALILTLCMAVTGTVCFAAGAAAAGGLQEIKAYLNSSITLKLDGETQVLTDASGVRTYPITYNNTTYLPIGSIGKLLGVDVGWDQATKSVLVGKQGEVDLIDAYKPYNTRQAIHVQSSERKTQDISGNTYSHWIMMDGYFAAIEIATSTASYNIEGKYDNLTFRYYSDCDCSLQVLGDNDAVLADISVKGGQVAQSVTVPLFKTFQLTFKTENVWGDANAYIIDAKLS